MGTAHTAAAAVAEVETRNNTNEIGQCNLKLWYMKTRVEDLASRLHQTKTKKCVSADVDAVMRNNAYAKARTETTEPESMESVYKIEVKHGSKRKRPLDRQNASDGPPTTVLSSRRYDWLSSAVNGCTLTVVQTATVCYYAATCQHVCLQNVTHDDVSDDDNARQRFTVLPSVLLVTTLRFAGHENVEKEAISTEMNNSMSLSSHDTSVTSNVSVAGAVTDDVRVDRSVSLSTEAANTSSVSTITNTTQKLQSSSNVNVATIITVAAENELTANKTNTTHSTRLPSALAVNTTMTTEAAKEELAKSNTSSIKNITSDTISRHGVNDKCKQQNLYYKAFVSRKQNERGKKIRLQISNEQTGSGESVETLAKKSVIKIESKDVADHYQHHQHVQSLSGDSDTEYLERSGKITEDNGTNRGKSRIDVQDWTCEQLNSYYKTFVSKKKKERAKRKKLKLQTNNKQAVPDRSTPTVAYSSHRHNDSLSPLDRCFLSSANRSYTLCYFVAVFQHVCLKNDYHLSVPYNTTTGVLEIYASGLAHQTSLPGTHSGTELNIVKKIKSTESLAKDSMMKIDTDDATENHQLIQSSANDSEAEYSMTPETLVEDDTSYDDISHYDADEKCEQQNYYKAFVSKRQKKHIRELRHPMDNQQIIFNRSMSTNSYAPHRFNNSLSPLDGCLLSANRSHTLCYFVAMCQHVCLKNLYMQDVQEVDDARRAVKRLSFAEIPVTSPASQPDIEKQSFSIKISTKTLISESDEDNLAAAAADDKTSSTSATQNATQKSQSAVPRPVLYVSRRRRNSRLSPIACSSSSNRSSALCYYMYVATCQHVCPNYDSRLDAKDDDNRYYLINPRSVVEFETSVSGLNNTKAKDMKKQANNKLRHEYNNISEQPNFYYKTFVTRRQRERGNRLITGSYDTDADYLTNNLPVNDGVSTATCNISVRANRTQELHYTSRYSLAAAETTATRETEVTKKANATATSDSTGQPAPVSTTATTKATEEELVNKSSATSTVGMIDNSMLVEDQHEQRLRSMEVKLLQLENQLLKSTADRGSCTTTNVELRNYVTHLERELMKRNQNFDELKTEAQQLRHSNLEAAAVEQCKVDKLKGIVSNQSSLLGSLQNKFTGLEIKMLQLENKMLQSTVDRSNETMKNVELENQVMHLERQLMSVSQKFDEVKSENEQLRQKNLELLVKEANDDDNHHQHKVDELRDVTSNQFSLLNGLQDKFVALERDNRFLVERVLNQSLMLTEIMLRVDRTTIAEADNRVNMRLQQELTTLSQSFVELKTEIDQLRQNSFELASKENENKNQQKLTEELHNITSNQSSALDALQNKFSGLERDHRLLVEQVLNQSLMTNEMMLRLEKLSFREQSPQLKQRDDNSGKTSAATVLRTPPSPNYNMFPDPPIYKTHDGFAAKGRRYFLV